MSELLRVLVVDDSAVVRQALSAVLRAAGGMEVVAAPDGVVAISKLGRFRPDVIVLDLDLPRMDGFAFLKWVMAHDRIPVVVCSGASGKGTDVAFRALEEGAVDVIGKPRLAVEEAGPALIEAIRGAAAARPRRRDEVAVDSARAERPRPGPIAASPSKHPPHAAAPRRLVVIGASTGGTEALHELLGGLPASVPGLVIVQHMPEVFTQRFAQRLDEDCALEVREARDGDEVRPGVALLAPGGRHAVVRRRGTRLLISLHGEPEVCRHRPSVDVLFCSAAEAAGPQAVGVLLTGMGADGADGLLALRRAGAATLAQDEASCVVFGMPREAILRGAAEEVVSLGRMAPALLRRIAQPQQDQPLQDHPGRTP